MGAFDGSQMVEIDNQDKYNKVREQIEEGSVALSKLDSVDFKVKMADNIKLPLEIAGNRNVGAALENSERLVEALAEIDTIDLSEITLTPEGQSPTVAGVKPNSDRGR